MPKGHPRTTFFARECSQGTVSFHNSHLTVNSSNADKTRLHARLIATYTFPPRSQTIVRVRLPPQIKGQCMIDNLPPDPHPNLVSARKLNTPINNMTVCGVFNSSDKPITLRPNAKHAKVEPIPQTSIFNIDDVTKLLTHQPKLHPQARRHQPTSSKMDLKMEE